MLTSPLVELKRATRFHQCVADADRLALVGNKPNLGTYVDYLARMYGFETALESALEPTPLAKTFDVGARAKSNALGSELCALGYPSSILPLLPRCNVTALPSTVDALGWLFVSESNRAGHDMFRTYLARVLPAVLDAPLVMSPRSASDSQRIDRLLLDLVHDDESVLDRVIEAAIAAFDSAHHWLRPNTPSGSQVRESRRPR